MADDFDKTDVFDDDPVVPRCGRQDHGDES